MPTTIMTPEEVLQFGKRVHLFPEVNSKLRHIYYVQPNNILVRKTILWEAGQEIDVYHSPVEINEIYNQIERVYSEERKGILIARRSGNPNSTSYNNKYPLPLKKTGKGMGKTVETFNANKVYKKLQHVTNEVERKGRKRHKQEQYY
jgi:hypothetical protein